MILDSIFLAAQNLSSEVLQPTTISFSKSFDFWPMCFLLSGSQVSNSAVLQ